MHSAVPTPLTPRQTFRVAGTCIALALALLRRAVERACGAYEAPLTVGTNTWTGYEPLYLARDLGSKQAPLRLVESGPPPRSMGWLHRLPSICRLTLTKPSDACPRKAFHLRRSGLDISS